MATFALQPGRQQSVVRTAIRPVPRRDAVSIVYALVLSLSVILIAIASSPVLCHPFLLPLACCGFLIGMDLVDWFRGSVDLFDARGTLGLLGFHFFLIAPLLMIATDYRMHYLPEQPNDYRDWLEAMGWLNACGLLVYRLIIDQKERKPRSGSRPRRQIVWKLQAQRFWITWFVLMLAAVGAEAWMMVRYGGVSGYLAAYSSWLAGGGDSFEGAALLFAVSESLPILLIFGFAFWAHRRRVNVLLILTVFVIFAALNFLIGGLRGSRSNVIWTTFWAAGILHLYVRRIPRAAAFASLVLLYGFVSFYAAYKQHGAQLFEVYASSGGEYSSLSRGVEDLPTVLVGDFSRTDVQSNLLWKMQQAGQVPLAWGGSYLGAVAILVPRSVWPERPPTLVRWSTDAEYGSGAYASGVMRSTRVYGIVGEAMMNFGLAGVPIAFFVLALLVRMLRSFSRSLERSDARVLFLPFLVNLLFLILLDDSDNVVFYLIKYGLVPAILLFCSTSRATRRFLPCKLQSHPLPSSAILSSSATLTGLPTSTSITRLHAIGSPLRSGSNF